MPPWRLPCVTALQAIGRGLADRCSSRFPGAVYAVNPDGLPVGTATGHRSVEDLPFDIDLAVINVPEADLATTVAACGAHGIGGFIVTTRVTDPRSILELPAASPTGSNQASPAVVVSRQS